MDATTEGRAAGSATDREGTGLGTRSAGQPAPGGEVASVGKASGGGSRASDGETFSDGETLLVSAGSLVRPPKPLRAAPRCTVLGVPGPVAFLSRPDGRPDGAALPPSRAPAGAAPRPAAEAGVATDVAERVSPGRSADARLYRGFDALVTFGGAALLGALVSFMIGERLLWPGAPVAPAPGEPAVTSSAAGPGSSSSPDAVRSEAAGPPRVGFASAFDFAPPPFEVPTALQAPWRDEAAMERGASPLAPDELAALVRDNLRLDAEVVALEAETMALEETLLDRELRLFSAGLSVEGTLDTAAAPGEGEAVAASESRSSPDVEPLPDEASGSAVGETVVSDPADGFADASLLADEDAARPTAEDDVSGTLELFASEMTSRSDEFDVADGTIASGTMGAPLQRFVVADVPPGSTAENVGLTPGDILLEIDDVEVIGIEDLIAAEDGNVEGGLYELTIVREGARFPLAYAGNIGALSLRLAWVDPVFAER